VGEGGEGMTPLYRLDGPRNQKEIERYTLVARERFAIILD
jgi:hypothetical protein